MNKQGTIPKPQSAMQYTAMRNSLNTFDVINCEHKDWFWRLVGHTAMVFRDKLTGQVGVYESTSLNKFSGISGVQLTPMRIWLKHYPGKVKVRRLFVDEDDTYSKYHRQLRAEAHIEKFRGVPYPDLSDPKQRRFLINSAIDLPLEIGLNPDRHDIMFCTQLVVDDYQDAGLYIGDWPPSEWQPDDMREGGKFEKRLAPGLRLGKEIRIK